jgi:hypothetical protein
MIEDGVRRGDMQVFRVLVLAGMDRCWPLIWVVAHDLGRDLCTVTVQRGGACALSSSGKGSREQRCRPRLARE